MNEPTMAVPEVFQTAADIMTRHVEGGIVTDIRAMEADIALSIAAAVEELTEELTFYRQRTDSLQGTVERQAAEIERLRRKLVAR